MHPFRCKPIYKEKVWGGRWFEEELGRVLPESIMIGESWELCCRKTENSVIVDGEYAGRTFTEMIQRFPKEFMGERIVKNGFKPFPLLIKFLDARDRLSVQVHPNDAYMIQNKLGDSGKAEMWYVLSAEPNARLIIGVKRGIAREVFEQRVADGYLHECLQEIPVKAGDAFYIPAGTVHAILEGVRVTEIQQNSDTTFRIYDWNRLGLDGQLRELHVNQALEVIEFSRSQEHPHQGLIIAGKGWQRRYFVACPQFVVEEIEVEQWSEKVNPERFEVWVVVDGKGELLVQDDTFRLMMGETWFIPASLGTYYLQGNIKLLRCYIPDLVAEVINPLWQAGYKPSDLGQIGGLESFISRW